MNTTANAASEANETKKARRTPEEARLARIEREANLAAKATQRAERLEAAAKKAKERAEKAATRQHEFEANVVVPRERHELPVIAEKTQTRVTKELKKALAALGTQFGLDFGDITPRLTQRGSALSLRITAHVAGVTKAAKKAVGASREATRFMENHKLVGIKPSVLGKEVQLAGEDGTYKFLGLRGRAHDVVLQKVGTDETKTVPADDFKTRMVAA